MQLLSSGVLYRRAAWLLAIHRVREGGRRPRAAALGRLAGRLFGAGVGARELLAQVPHRRAASVRFSLE